MRSVITVVTRIYVTTLDTQTLHIYSGRVLSLCAVYKYRNVVMCKHEIIVWTIF